MISSEACVLLSLLVAGLSVAYYATKRHSNSPGPALRGPPSKSLLLGVSQYVHAAEDPGSVYEAWAKEYGTVYKTKTILGAEQVVVCDYKAVSHIFARDTMTYVRTPGFRMTIEVVIGKGVAWAEGEDHKRQRKALNPAFSAAAVKNMFSTFLDVTYQMKAAWDVIIDSNATGEAVIEVQDWMGNLVLDTIGMAGFAHDFGAMRGEKSAISDALRIFSEAKPSPINVFAQMAQAFIPLAGRIPILRNRLLVNLSNASRDIMEKLFRATKDNQGLTEEQDVRKTALGILIDAEKQSSEFHMSFEEVVTQMKTILIAGYDPPSINIVWALVELARHTDIQSRLREELAQFHDQDPTYEQLQTQCPLLDAILSEVLRLHFTIRELQRQAAEDDVIPLSTPVINQHGQTLDSILISKGTLVTVPINYMNQSTVFWGPDAKEFNPFRWIERRADEGFGQAPRRIFSFGDGPRVCLGKAFALTQAKVVLAILIHNYTFELLHGPKTEIETHNFLLPRPKAKGQDGAKVPLRIRRVE